MLVSAKLKRARILRITLDISWKQLKKLRPQWSDDSCRQIFRKIAAQLSSEMEGYADAVMASMIACYDAEEEERD